MPTSDAVLDGAAAALLSGVRLRRSGTSVSVPFRSMLVLMVLGRYGYGDHVSDPRAFRLRLLSIL